MNIFILFIHSNKYSSEKKIFLNYGGIKINLIIYIFIII
jgi:hypothetical protein